LLGKFGEEVEYPGCLIYAFIVNVILIKVKIKANLQVERTRAQVVDIFYLLNYAATFILNS
jgi:hypothetical protein